MSLRVAIHCPFCKRPMAASSAFAGQMIACPNCRGEFLMTPPGMTPPPATPVAPPTASHAAPPVATNPAPPAQAVAVAAPPAPRPIAAPVPAVAPPPATVPAQPPPNTARFKTAATQDSAIAPAADGKLPTLQLADAAPAAKGGSGERGIPLWAAVMAVVASTVVSAILLLGGLEGTQTTASRRATARQKLAEHYATGSAELRPYQVLLREAQQAHTRGEFATERKKYRDVLALLRAEGRTRFEGLTGTPSGDQDLEEQLSILLAND